MNTILNYITKNYKQDEPIFLFDIEIEGMSGDNIRQQIKHLVDKGILKRFDKGIYYIPSKTIINTDSVLSKDRVIEYKYIKNDNNVFGYLSGLKFFNQIGLSTQISMQYDIVSNMATTTYRETNLKNQKVIIRKPKIKIDDNNYKELQFLDLIRDVDIYSELQGDDLKNCLSNYLKKTNLTINKLEPFFKYYPDKLYKNLIETKVIYNDILAFQ